MTRGKPMIGALVRDVSKIMKIVTAYMCDGKGEYIRFAVITMGEQVYGVPITSCIGYQQGTNPFSDARHFKEQGSGRIGV